MMKLRWLKTTNVEYVQEGGMYNALYRKKENVTKELQYYDEEFSQWLTVPTVEEKHNG